MKVAVVYQYFDDHQSPGHSLIYELTQYLAAQKHDVTVIAGEKGYMQRGEPEALFWYQRLLRRERYGSVDVIRTFTYSRAQKSYLGRLMGFLSFSLSAPIGLLRAPRPDVVLASSPPIFAMLPVWMVCKLRRVPLVFEVRDLWPESAVQMGIVKNRSLIAIMSWIERILYNNSALIVTLTRGIKRDIEARGWSPDKIEVITCGIDGSMLFPDQAAGVALRQDRGWNERKIVLYLGALGEANNIDVILDAAARTSDPTMLFLLVGDGMRRAEIQQKIADRALGNIRWLPAVPKSEVRAYINAADICVVTLQNIPLFRGAIPTKLLDYMACGKPVLCGIEGEAAEIVNAAGAGIVFAPDDGLRLAQLASDLLADKDRRKAMGTGGLDYIRTHFNAENNRILTEKLLFQVLSETGGNVIREHT